MDALDARGQPVDYAVHHTHDGQQWEITTKKNNIYSSLPDRFPDQGAAIAAGEGWLVPVVEQALNPKPEAHARRCAPRIQRLNKNVRTPMLPDSQEEAQYVGQF